MGCNDCHPGTDSAGTRTDRRYHGNSKIDVSLDSFAVSTTAAFFNTANGTCTNVYCHSPAGTTGKSTISWDTTGLNCVSCHRSPPSDSAHGKHSRYECAFCHAGYSITDSMANPATHVNRKVDVVIQKNAAIGGLDSARYVSGTCLNISCHGAGHKDSLGIAWQNRAVAWRDSLDCASCHQTNQHFAVMRAQSGADCYWCHDAVFHPDAADTTVGCGACHSIPPKDASHTAHAASARSDCNECHRGYRGADAVVDGIKHINGIVNVDGTIGGGTFSATDSSCGNVYCHGAFAGGDSADVVWNSGPVFCGTCHSGAPDRGAHGVHSRKGIACDSCHSGYSVADSTVNKAAHTNFIVDVNPTPAGGTYDSSATSCSSVRCHGGNPVAVGWYDSALVCGSCHMLPPQDRSHLRHVDSLDNDCNTCHTGYRMVDSSLNGSVHNDGHVNVNGNLSGGSYRAVDSTCSGVYCHGSFMGGTPQMPKWGSGTVSCGSCHTLPPATSSHRRHSDSLGYDCNVCHAGYSETLLSVSPRTHVDSSISVNGNLSGGVYSSVNKRCSGVYCHGSFRGGDTATPIWDNGPVGCGTCHSTVPTTGAHTVHIANNAIGCDSCHAGYRLSDSSTSKLHHVDSIFTIDGPLAGGRWNRADTTCSSVACHGSSAALNWYSGTLSCGSCHALPPASGAHDMHSVTNGVDCGKCHAGYRMTDSTISPTHHNNAVVEVDGTLDGGTYTAIDSSCSNVSCHVGLTRPVNWYTGTIRCGSCHGLPPDSGAHTVHVTDEQVDCEVCHSGYRMADSSRNAQHHGNGTTDIDGLLDGGRFTRSDTSCSNVGCHGGSAVPVNWYDTTLTCGLCHALPPATGSHGYHVATEHIDCSECHSGFSMVDSSVSQVNHNNGTTEVDGSIDGGSFTHGDSSCSNVGCHGAASAINWYTGSIGCGTCHGTPPDSGAHLVHTTNNGIDCSECHEGYSMLDSSIFASHHRNSVVEVDGPLKGGAFVPAGSTCTNVYCHGKFTGGNADSPDWYGSVSCGSCHDLLPQSGTHAVHVVDRNYDCGVCHNGYSRITMATHATHHIDSVNQVDGTLGSTLGAGGTYNSTARTCTNTYCHGNFTNGLNDTPVWATTENCGSCHTMTSSSGEHRQHRNEGLGCNTCHPGYTSGSTVNWSTHANGSVQVQMAASIGGTYTAGGRGTCSGLAGGPCHGSESWR